MARTRELVIDEFSGFSAVLLARERLSMLDKESGSSWDGLSGRATTGAELA